MIEAGNDNRPVCPEHGEELCMMYGNGWDYDRLICAVYGCEYEVELETTTEAPE